MKNKRLEARFDWAVQRLRMLLKEVNRYPNPDYINEALISEALTHVKEALKLLEKALEDTEEVWQKQQTVEVG